MSRTSKESWFKGAIGTIILSLIAAIIYDYIKDQPILSTLKIIFINFWSFLSNLFSIELKLWLVIFILSLYKITKSLYKKLQKDKIPDLPINLKNYKDDNFKNWRWKWNWKWDTTKNRWVITSLWPFCKNCDIKLLDKSNMIQNIMKCPRCDKYFKDYEIDDSKGVEALIYDNLEKGRI